MVCFWVRNSLSNGSSFFRCSKDNFCKAWSASSFCLSTYFLSYIKQIQLTDDYKQKLPVSNTTVIQSTYWLKRPTQIPLHEQSITSNAIIWNFSRGLCKKRLIMNQKWWNKLWNKNIIETNTNGHQTIMITTLTCWRKLSESYRWTHNLRRTVNQI